MGLQGGVMTPAQVSGTAERGGDSAASAFAALVEGMLPSAPAEEDVAPQGGEEDADDVQDPGDEDQAEVLVVPPLPMPLKENTTTPVEDGVAVALDKVTPVAVPVVAPARIARPQPAFGVAEPDTTVPEIATPVSAASTGTVETDPLVEPAAAQQLSVEPPPANRQAAAQQPLPVPSADSARSRDVGSATEPTVAQQEKPTATDGGDAPEMTTSFDLPDQTTLTISVHDARTAASPETQVMTRGHAAAEARHVLRQLGEKLSDNAEGVVEIALSPEELGKVRLVIGSGDKPAVTVFADRPETYELLRRNADALDKELRSAGIFGADISFSGGSDARDGRNAPGGDRRGAGQREGSANFTEQMMPARPRPIADRRIDIRI